MINITCRFIWKNVNIKKNKEKKKRKNSNSDEIDESFDGSIEKVFIFSKTIS